MENDVKYQCESMMEDCITDLRIGFEWLEEAPSSVSDEALIHITESFLKNLVIKAVNKLEELGKVGEQYVK